MSEFFDVLNERAEYTGITESRDNCHQKGLWHKAVVVFILNSKSQILLQRRSAKKKIWPNMWDVSAGGHVLHGEFGFQAAIRETSEELGISISPSELCFIGATVSSSEVGNIIDNHFNEYYIVNKDIELIDICLQEEEVCDVKWIDVNEIIDKIRNEYHDLTKKNGCWNYLLRYLEIITSGV